MLYAPGEGDDISARGFFSNTSSAVHFSRYYTRFVTEKGKEEDERRRPELEREISTW